MKQAIAAFFALCLSGCNAPADDTQPTRAPTIAATTAGINKLVTDTKAGDEAPTTHASEAVSHQPKLAVDPDGLRWFLPPNGAARPIPFGTSQAEVLASLERVRGKAAEGPNADCGAGPIQYANWADGLSLVFQNGRFVGWGLDGRAQDAITTADGVGIGTTRTELDDAFGPAIDVRKSTLGTEFTAGSYHGLFDGAGANAHISDIWAGISCVAR